MQWVTHVSRITNMMHKLGLYPPIEKMVLGDNKIYIYFLEESYE